MSKKTKYRHPKKARVNAEIIREARKQAAFEQKAAEIFNWMEQTLWCEALRGVAYHARTTFDLHDPQPGKIIRRIHYDLLRDTRPARIRLPPPWPKDPPAADDPPPD